MSCLMLLPVVVLLVFGPAGSSGRVMEKEIWKSGVRDANTSHVASPASPGPALFYFWSGTLLLAWFAVRQQESTLAIRARSSRHNDARRFFDLASP